MRASVVVVTFNNAHQIEACLESVLADIGPHDELIVVDNGSSDGTPALLRARFPGVRLIEGPNDGYAGGNNRGARQARGEHLVFLNPDTVVRPGAIAALLAPLARPSVGLSTACVVHMWRPAIVNACGNTMHYTGLTYCRGAGRPVAEYAAPAKVDAVSGAAFAIRRALFEALGGFDERFFMYVEDTDLSLRARLAGFRCAYAPRAVVEHDYRPSYTPAKAFYLDRNRHLMLLKNIGAATYLRMLPGLLLGEVVTWGFLLLRGPRFWGVKPRVYAALWADRAAIRADRRARQARRGHDHAILGRLTYRLDFGQLAGGALARAAAAVFHPAFWAMRLLVGWRQA
jgi:GT2 family glycosyltransferase